VVTSSCVIIARTTSEYIASGLVSAVPVSRSAPVTASMAQASLAPQHLWRSVRHSARIPPRYEKRGRRAIGSRDAWQANILSGNHILHAPIAGNRISAQPARRLQARARPWPVVNPGQTFGKLRLAPMGGRKGDYVRDQG